jgi:dynein regulatory complex protein 1
MKKFKKDIEDMLAYMRKQFIDLRNQMLIHINKIEDEFLEDRQRLIQDYKEKVGNLLKNLQQVESNEERELTLLEERKEAEADRMATKQENDFICKVMKMEKYFNYLKETTENFNYDLRILLERLDYRVEVRDEKIRENKDKKAQYDKAYAKLRERIQENNRFYLYKDKANRRENHLLKEELVKMTDSYDQLKLKFQHFEKYDNLRFKDIYEMKSKEARELALKVAFAERTIRTQQLGLEISNNDNQGFTLEELQREQDINEENLDEEKKPEDDEETFRKNILSRIPMERVKQVFRYIISEAEFLIETTVRFYVII